MGGRVAGEEEEGESTSRLLQSLKETRNGKGERRSALASNINSRNILENSRLNGKTVFHLLESKEINKALDIHAP